MGSQVTRMDYDVSALLEEQMTERFEVTEAGVLEVQLSARSLRSCGLRRPTKWERSGVSGRCL